MKIVDIKYILLAIALAVGTTACDEDDTSITPTGETFPVGTVTWRADVSAADREVIAGLVENMVKVESCRFYMGAQTKSYTSANYFRGTLDTATWVGPVITVSMPDYYIGRYEVTQGQWRAVMGDVPPTGKYCKFPDVERNAPWYAETGLGDDVAAYNISYDDAQAFCARLNQKTGLRFRLPTEAEWECAARGGRYSKGYSFIGAESYSEAGWYSGNVTSDSYGVHAGGGKAANELGLYDMSGNVSEWVANSYYKYSGNDTINPQGPATLGDTLILRGGSWTQSQAADFCPASRKKFIRSTYQTEESLHSAIANCGFRLAL